MVRKTADRQQPEAVAPVARVRAAYSITVRSASKQGAKTEVSAALAGADAAAEAHAHALIDELAEGPGLEVAVRMVGAVGLLPDGVTPGLIDSSIVVALKRTPAPELVLQVS